MRRYWYATFAITAIIGFAVLGCSESDAPVTPTVYPGASKTMEIENPCGDPLTVTFFAGQHIDVGTVTVANDAGFLCIEIATTGGWFMTEAHAATALDLDDLPMTGSGNPQVGHFELSAEFDVPVDSYEFCIDLVEYGYEVGANLFVAVHAAVELQDEEGNPIQEETAWADGAEFPGRSWATYFTYVVQECDEETPCTITVLQPDGLRSFCSGDTTEIVWEYAGTCAGEVLIEILQGGYRCQVIDWSAPNTGSFLWEGIAPCEGTAGYQIRITEVSEGLEDPASGDSNLFEMFPCGGGGEE